jgi:hypothetical protein
MLLQTQRSSRHRSYWVIVIDSTECSLQKYHLVKVDFSITEDVLSSTFLRSLIQRMPPFMNSVLSALNNKSINCSFCSEILLDHIGSLAIKHSHSQLLKMYDSEESFCIYCIECIACHYIAKALDSLEIDDKKPLSREEYWLIMKSCKEISNKKQEKRRRNEMYLGKCSFSDELRRSFDEFMETVVKALGFRPYKFE